MLDLRGIAARSDGLENVNFVVDAAAGQVARYAASLATDVIL